MKTKLDKLFFPVIVTFVFGLTACYNDRGVPKTHSNDEHATEPKEPSDAEYPGSKQYDSVHHSDTIKHH